MAALLKSTKMKDTSRKTVYVIGNEHVFDMPPDGTIERPFATIEEAIYSLSDDKDPEPHQLVYPKNIDFIVMNAPNPVFKLALVK